MLWSSCTATSLEPFTADPAVEELQTGLGLVHGDHVASAVETHEGEVAVGFDLANLLALVLVLHDFDVLQGSSSVLLLAGPLESLSPGLVAQPVADEVGVTGVDQDRDLLKKVGDQTVVGLHPVTVEQEVTVDVKIARVVALDLSTDGLANFGLVQVFRDIVHALIAQVGPRITLGADVVDVLSSLLVRANEGVVAVDRSRNAQEGTLSVVARLNQGLAAGQSIVHGLAAGLVQDSRVATIATRHGTVVIVLGETVGETVTDQNGLKVDVTLLVRQDLGSKDRDIVASVRLSRNVEVLLRILRELLEEEGEQGIDILASSYRVTDGRTAVRVSDVDRLVKEDDGGIGIPGIVIVNRLDVLTDAARTQLQEQTSERRAARATVQPENDGVVLRIVARFEEP